MTPPYNGPYETNKRLFVGMNPSGQLKIDSGQLWYPLRG